MEMLSSALNLIGELLKKRPDYGEKRLEEYETVKENYLREINRLHPDTQRIGELEYVLRCKFSEISRNVSSSGR